MRQLRHLFALTLGVLAFTAASGAYRHETQAAKGYAMQGFVGNIEELTEKNSNFRRVLYTGHQLQLVVMTLRPGEDIGEETHDDGDQFFRVEEGEGEVLIDGKRSRIKSGDAVLIPGVPGTTSSIQERNRCTSTHFTHPLSIATGPCTRRRAMPKPRSILTARRRSDRRLFPRHPRVTTVSSCALRRYRSCARNHRKLFLVGNGDVAAFGATGG